jgi:2-polyprenyl-3-methyl-5-hydroxy-6-metoxy-1,4-benzoquinol methylase
MRRNSLARADQDAVPSYATFVSRDKCIGCQSSRLFRVAGGTFGEDPLRSFLEGSPWGVQPLPYIEAAPWEFVRCEECGQAFHRYILSPEWQERRFAEWMGRTAIERFERDRGMNSFPFVFRETEEKTGRLLKLEKLTRPIRSRHDRVRLLDFGCGWGAIPALAKLFGFDAYGLDRDRHRLGSSAPSNVYADLHSLDAATKGARFHAVTLIEVIEHVDDPLQVLRLVGDRMERGGILLLEAPDCKGVRGITTETDYDLIHPLEHINCFTASSLGKMAARAGFRVVHAPAAYVTADLLRVAKAFVKNALLRARPMTRLYFQKV